REEPRQRKPHRLHAADERLGRRNFVDAVREREREAGHQAEYEEARVGGGRGAAVAADQEVLVGFHRGDCSGGELPGSTPLTRNPSDRFTIASPPPAAWPRPRRRRAAAARRAPAAILACRPARRAPP